MPSGGKRPGPGSGTPFVRNDESKREGAAYSLGSAFANAAKGFAYSLASQRNMKIHLVVGIIAVALGFLFSITAVEWLAVVLCIVVVMALECVNTAIESVVDLVSPDYHPLAGKAKDCAAAAVFLAAIGAVVVEAIIIVPRLLSIVGG